MKFSCGYTIFNKKSLLPKVVFGIKDAFTEEDEIIFLFDNCSDGSIEEFNRLKHYLPSEPKIIISPTDLYEVKANNRILHESTGDFVALFQDDIVLHDKFFKNKVMVIADRYKNELGLMGCRSGYELTGDTTFPEQSYHRVSNWEHLDKQYGYRLDEGEWKERTVLNRGPIVFSRDLINEVGYLDEAFYPLWGDDMDYCLRSRLKFNKKNIVFQCNVESQLSWGSTHQRGKIYPTEDGSISHGSLVKKNWRFLMSRWSQTLKDKYENLVKLIS